MKVFKYPSAAAQKRLDAIVNRDLAFKARDLQAVKRILADVRKNKDKALIGYINRFDAPKLTAGTLKVTKTEFNQARSRVDKGFLRSLNKAAKQIEAFHRHQVEQSWFTTNVDGTMLGQMVKPVDAAGVYVPGGRGGETPLVSSVLMGCIPARIAGVKNICITTPPTKSGEVNPHVLVAAQRVGVDTIYKAGSAWGIAALAYGTETVPKVDVIVGPGNIYVTLAKKMVAGTVGIDMVAGPSEILVIADEKASPAYVAADLLSQAEHDPLASAVLLTTSARLAKAVSDAVAEQLKALPRRAIAEASIKTYGAIMVVPDLTAAFDLANQIAPEHLELQIEEPLQYLGRIQNAGAVFLGPYTPEPVGDYIAGPNHVLPTAGTARFGSALSVDHFVKKTSVVYYAAKALKRDASDIIRLAEIEGLVAHARAVRIRKKR
ncbi:MAG: histidinol dehydrogenase [Deltaproteobacteria bacterium]|nr:histidinol dehydrogenase [Deltaproteobacteria bacterium]MBW2075280.1 histidinol dehydrogenase [Deltaproteobacteria bacterium]RLB81279.1 MAG: histidinol dehydrogenase [Deltaproteobacteria bacterium]